MCGLHTPTHLSTNFSAIVLSSVSKMADYSSAVWWKQSAIQPLASTDMHIVYFSKLSMATAQSILDLWGLYRYQCLRKKQYHGLYLFWFSLYLNTTETQGSLNVVLKVWQHTTEKSSCWCSLVDKLCHGDTFYMTSNISWTFLMTYQPMGQ